MAVLVPRHDPPSSSSPSTSTRIDIQVQSVLSGSSMLSASSYRTAPLSPASVPSHASSSLSLNERSPRESSPSGPIFTYAASQEAHTPLFGEKVQMETDSVSAQASTMRRNTQADSVVSVGPPPPSPPASTENSGELDIDSFTISQASGTVKGLNPESASNRVRRSSGASESENERQPNISAFHQVRIVPSAPEKMQRSMSENRPTRSAPLILNPPSQPFSADVVRVSASESAARIPSGTYLQPPQPTTPPSKPVRRNTTGSTPVPSKRVHAKLPSQPFAPTDDAKLGEGSQEIASDIEIHAEKIRRERNAKRAKQQQEAEAALTRSEVATTAVETAQDRPLVGNLIGEDHVNYVLMYNMLTGIRIAVCHLVLVNYNCNSS